MTVPGLLVAVPIALLVGVVPVGAVALEDGRPPARQISPGHATHVAALASRSAGFHSTAFSGAAEPLLPPDRGATVNRSFSRPGPAGVAVAAGRRAKLNPQLVTSFDGLAHRDQRLANGGNQFSVEPPDQALCVGNGFVVESVNAVLRVFDTQGNALTGAIDLNTFYGYPAAIDRATGAFGPYLVDPSCHFDPDTQRWFHVALTLDVDVATGRFLGPNRLDIAVSRTADPTGAWLIYRLPVQNDGTDGTPDHGCSLHPDGTGHGPCLGDYPHIGADAHGFYITTNEYSLFGPEFKSANIYAFSKSALAAGAGAVTVVQLETRGAAAGNPGFTVWPAISAAGQYRADDGGTEFFLSSDAAAEAGGSGSSSRIFLWRLTNTSSLETPFPALFLGNVAVAVNAYAIPPKGEQKAGDFPLGQCLNDSAIVTPFGPGCWRNIVETGGPFSETLSTLDSGDTRMQQVVYANGKVWGALGTAVTVQGANRAGIEWFIINPSSTRLVRQGYLALADAHLIYPAVGVSASGRGVIAFTLVGPDDHPSAAYAALGSLAGAGPVRVAAAGAGPHDGFTAYKALVGDPPRTRWGDYGAAAMDGRSVWIASEYIAQECTLAEYALAPLGSCGDTRTALGNWATRISEVVP